MPAGRSQSVHRRHKFSILVLITCIQIVAGFAAWQSTEPIRRHVLCQSKRYLQLHAKAGSDWLTFHLELKSPERSTHGGSAGIRSAVTDRVYTLYSVAFCPGEVKVCYSRPVSCESDRTFSVSIPECQLQLLASVWSSDNRPGGPIQVDAVSFGIPAVCCWTLISAVRSTGSFPH